MRCKRHTVDFSSSIGVCASCLRERLFSLAVSTAASQTDDHHHHSRISPPPPPLLFPRSVSPYVAPRKSDAGAGTGVDSVVSSSNNRFFSTPQVLGGGRGSTTSSEKVFVPSSSFKKNKKSGLSRFSSFFRPTTRSDVYDSRRDSCDDASTVFSQSSTSSSRSWLSKVLSVRSKKQQSNTTTCYIEDLIASESDHHNHQNRPRQRYCRGMSPAGESTTNEDSVEESPGRLRRTPAMGTPGRKPKVGFGRSVSGMAFCLSPLVRAKPSNCSSNWRGRFLPDFGYSGDMNSPAKPHLSTAASFCGNRSKKLVDLGRLDHRR
ncbi:PREDICTED: uncharacterized protein LOC104783011 [Camelina sativa]|uniref:Uncharacterized protein LOC104783011 n=1 Tax=Camelina sativa TaxID=90675 RepID=A0ABM0YV99_CAMSA|nr:PREDICTED: uncharacterized protein LOC104783011 [Camelina sativa]